MRPAQKKVIGMLPASGNKRRPSTSRESSRGPQLPGAPRQRREVAPLGTRVWRRPSSRAALPPSPEVEKTHLCLLDVSSALGRQPHGTSCRLSRRLSTVTALRCTTWNPGAMPPLCRSLGHRQLSQSASQTFPTSHADGVVPGARLPKIQGVSLWPKRDHADSPVPGLKTRL